MTEHDSELAGAEDARAVPAGPQAGYDGAELAVPSRDEMAAIIGANPIDYRAWVRALITDEAMEETDTEEASLTLVRAILAAETSEAALGVTSVISVKELLGETPGARSNVYEITDVRPMASTFDEGPGSFVVISARDLAEGVDVTLSCGARAVQAVLMKHKYEAWLPLKAMFTRRLKPTRAGFYPINLEAGV